MASTFTIHHVLSSDALRRFLSPPLTQTRLSSYAARLGPLFGGHLRGAGFTVLTSPSFPSATGCWILLFGYVEILDWAGRHAKTKSWTRAKIHTYQTK
jgi:hypothetical protein